MKKSLPESPQAVLFDLDGTLLDTAPDLHGALAVYCGEAGVAVPAYEAVREVVSRGSRHILRCAFDESDEALFERMPRYLELYHSMMTRHSRPFDGIELLLDTLESSGLAWGIVTNKPGYLTDDLVRQIGWGERVCAVVSGDTLPVAKPDPAPVLLACERAGLDPARCIFVGDDPRDVQAGRGAGLYTVAVRWGYLDGSDPHTWGADVVLEHPHDLIGQLALKMPA